MSEIGKRDFQVDVGSCRGERVEYIATVSSHVVKFDVTLYSVKYKGQCKQGSLFLFYFAYGTTRVLGLSRADTFARRVE